MKRITNDPRKRAIKDSYSRKIFVIGNLFFLVALSFLCFMPIWHVFVVSISSAGPVAAGKVTLTPIGFTLKAYEFMATKPEFLKAMWVSIQRIVLALLIHMSFVLLAAYPLSKETKAFRWRNFYTWFFFMTMLFQGGLIPTFFVVKTTGLINTIWALILPSAIHNSWNIILMLNFFRQLPKELEEAAYMDGANHWRVLFQVYVPTSMASIATITLFIMVNQWNQWFDGMIFMEDPSKFPLQTYLRTILQKLETTSLDFNDIELMKLVSNETSKAAQIFIGMLPILCIYPFLQRYFAKGIVLGSVKG